MRCRAVRLMLTGLGSDNSEWHTTQCVRRRFHWGKHRNVFLIEWYGRLDG